MILNCMQFLLHYDSFKQLYFKLYSVFLQSQKCRQLIIVNFRVHLVTYLILLLSQEASMEGRMARTKW
jgi:hypothetical protein